MMVHLSVHEIPNTAKETITAFSTFAIWLSETCWHKS